MFELLLGAMVLAACFKVGVRATVDAITTTRAAKAGQWDLIDRDRQRRAEQVPWAERWAKAWAERRKARHEQAGGDGEFRPGAREYLRDLYHGFWEDKLDHRQKRREGRPEWQYDPDGKPWHARFDDAFNAKVDRLRGRWGQRAEPQSTAEPQPVPLPDPADLPPGTWTPGPDGERLPLTADPEPQPAETPSAVDETTAPTDTEPEEKDMPEVTQAAVATEVNNNEDARRAFQEQIDAANAAADALAAYEVAQRRLSGSATAGLDGIHAKRFDRLAQASQANAADLLPASDMSQAAGAIEGIRAAAESGLAALDKYQDAEQLVNSEQVDGSTLETAASS